jgi:ATP-binding cassette subfamily B (MDR/TAP) protein 7
LALLVLFHTPEHEHVNTAMLISPLARAARRPGLSPNWCHHLRPYPLYYTSRVFTSSSLHRKDVHGQRPIPGSPAALDATKAAKPVADSAKPMLPAAPKTDPLLAEQNLTNKEQRKADWAIIKEMSRYLWPKDFKSIVDSMNIDFATLGGTATTVAGSMIVACKLLRSLLLLPLHCD